MHGVQSHTEGAQAHVVGHGPHPPGLEVHGGGPEGGHGRLAEGGRVRHIAAVLKKKLY